MKPPPDIRGLTVAIHGGVADISIDDPQSQPGIYYFLERDESPEFHAPHVYFLGSNKTLRIELRKLSEKQNWRAYSQFLGSQPSTPVNANPQPPAAPTPSSTSVNTQQHGIGVVTETSPTTATLTARESAQAERIERLLGLLRDAEWSWVVTIGNPFCIFCKRNRHEGHAPDCPLDVELKGGK